MDFTETETDTESRNGKYMHNGAHAVSIVEMQKLDLA